MLQTLLRRVVIITSVAGALGALALAQSQSGAEQLMQQARTKAVVEGRLDEAIKLYADVAAKFAGDRATVVRALIEMADCHQKLGQAKAREIYERIVREYGDQTAAAAEARAKLAVLAGPARGASGSAMAVRRVWSGPKVDAMGRVSPDGRFLSFTDWDTGNLAIHDLATGQDRILTNLDPLGTSTEFAEESVPSPDGRHIVFNWYNADGSYDLRLVGLDGTKPRVVRTAGEGVVGLSPTAWSPDGRHLLTEFTKADQTVDMMLVAISDGSARLLKAMGTDPSPGGVFSPDGRYIAWAVKNGISLVDLHTGEETPLVPDLARHSVLGWTPDGRYILFSSERSGAADAWLVAVAGGKAGEPELVKKGYSGSALGFTRTGTFYYGVYNITREIHIGDWDPASGSLTTPSEPVSRRWSGVSRCPDWSPDGKFLAYVRSPTATDSFIVIRSTGTGEERELKIAKTRMGLTLRWAPDGDTIVASGFEAGKGWNLLRVDVQTGRATTLMPLPLGGPMPRFDMSPDGRTLVYIKYLPAPNANLTKLMARDMQSGRDTEILQRPLLYWVSVSPDGKRLAIVAQEDGSLVVRILPVAGGEARELVRIAADEATYSVGPSWTPDGRHLLFAKGQKGRAAKGVQVWRVAAEGGTPRRLGLTVDGLWWLRLHPDGRRVALGTSTTNNEVWVMENFLPKAPAAPVGKAK